MQVKMMHETLENGLSKNIQERLKRLNDKRESPDLEFSGMTWNPQHPSPRLPSDVLRVFFCM